MGEYPEGQEDAKDDAEYNMMFGIVPTFGKIGGKVGIVKLMVIDKIGGRTEISIIELEKDGIFIEGKTILTSADAKKIREWWDKKRNV